MFDGGHPYRVVDLGALRIPGSTRMLGLSFFLVGNTTVVSSSSGCDSSSSSSNIPRVLFSRMISRFAMSGSPRCFGGAGFLVPTRRCAYFEDIFLSCESQSKFAPGCCCFAAFGVTAREGVLGRSTSNRLSIGLFRKSSISSSFAEVESDSGLSLEKSFARLAIEKTEFTIVSLHRHCCSNSCEESLQRRQWVSDFQRVLILFPLATQTQILLNTRIVVQNEIRSRRLLKFPVKCHIPAGIPRIHWNSCLQPNRLL